MRQLEIKAGSARKITGSPAVPSCSERGEVVESFRFVFLLVFFLYPDRSASLNIRTIVNEFEECLEFVNELGNLRLGVSSCTHSQDKKNENVDASLYEPLRCYKVLNPQGISRIRDIPYIAFSGLKEYYHARFASRALVAHYRRQLRCLPVLFTETDKTEKKVERRIV
ncbi:hypothetical protein G5I_10764 [Acromyrmex echinatior]|uniref:Uncharacterized protein n=1 Tax=Acromyrmex echinatior TaxID=103372 RepID=F4WXS4_ACREC|nr:hypothetical protein G5I_10764 [Acromyrmex echinatior]